MVDLNPTEAFGFRIGDEVQTMPLGPAGAWRMKGIITGFIVREAKIFSDAILDNKKIAPISLLEGKERDA